MDPTIQRLTTGISGLDDVLNGGLDAGRLYLVDGHPGTGKTTLALQFLLAGVARGETGLYVTLSESASELQVVAQRHGWSLEGVSLFELVPPEATLDPDRELTLLHPAEMELSETTKLIFDRVSSLNPTRVIFDSLSEMRLLAQNALRYRRQILALKHYFSGRQSTVLLIDDLSAHSNDLQLHSIAHGVITLEQLALEYGAERRRLRVVKMRGAAFRGGYHDFTIKKGGLSVYPRLIAAEHREPFLTGIVESDNKELDQLLGGGLERGTSALLIGGAGVGKSTVALAYAVAAATRGEHASIFAFEEGLATIHARAAGLGLPLDSLVQSGMIHIQQINPAEMSPGEFASIVRRNIEDEKAKLVVIDSLNGYLNSMPDERFLVLQLHELLNFLNQRGTLTLVVLAQHGLVGMMQAPVDLSYVSDAVIMFRYFEAEGHVRRAISVVKKRSGPHENTIREFSLTSKGLHVGPPLTQFRGVFTGVPVYTGGALPPIQSDQNDDPNP
jgi:circadian clock protein KaiC